MKRNTAHYACYMTDVSYENFTAGIYRENFAAGIYRINNTPMDALRASALVVDTRTNELVKCSENLEFLIDNCYMITTGV